MNIDKIVVDEKTLQATTQEIEMVEKSLGCSIPVVYKEFLLQMNGAVMNQCVLYDTNTLADSYFCNEYRKYNSDYIGIGNDNGDRELVMIAKEDERLCGFIDVGAIGTSTPEEWFEFVNWVENGCQMQEVCSDLSVFGKVFLVKAPTDKLKDLMRIKKVFNIDIPTKELLQAVEDLPFEVCENVTGVKALRLIEKADCGDCLRFVKEL